MFPDNKTSEIFFFCLLPFAFGFSFFSEGLLSSGLASFFVSFISFLSSFFSFLGGSGGTSSFLSSSKKSISFSTTWVSTPFLLFFVPFFR